MPSPFRSVRHLRRYSEIASVFIRHGFGFAFNVLNLDWSFLRRDMRLPAARKPDTPTEDLAVQFSLALEELGPTFIKLGQILSTRPDMLPPAFVLELSKLQDMVPPVPWESIREVLVQEFGRDPEQVFLEIDHQPMAAASLAQVHAATLPDGLDVVVKVQKPGIYTVIDTDLEILAILAARAQTTRWGQIYDFVTMVNDFSFLLRSELDYRREGRNADRFRENFTGEPYLYIPRVYWAVSTQRVIVLERIRGIKIDDIEALDAAGYNRHQIAVNSARIIIKEVLEDGFFHADPHPGNFYVLPGEVIGAMDFGMVGYLKAQARINLIRLYMVSVSLDADGIVDQFIRMGATGAEVDRAGLSRDLGRLLNKYYTLALKDIRAREVIEEIMPIAFQYHIRLPDDLWLLGKTLMMMEGVGLRLDPDFNIFEVAQPFVRRLVWHTVQPGPRWERAILFGGASWAELIGHLPGAGNRLLERLERNEPLKVSFEGADPALHHLDRLFARLSLSVLAGAVILGLALLIPSVVPNTWIYWIVVAGVIASAGLIIGWLITMVQQKK
jgi:ubiquinone biosynthesis protein